MSGERTTSAPELRSPRILEVEVRGMTCGGCARHVTEAIQGVAGVHSASVSLEQQRATVRWTPEAEPNLEAVIKVIVAEGFQAREVPAGRGASAETGRRMAGWFTNLVVGVPAMVVLMLGEWVFSLGMTPWFQWVALGLATVVQVVAGARFYRGAWAQLKLGASNMDTLVALGSSTAFGYSTWALLTGRGGHVYFMEAAAIITLISLGHWIESRVSSRASDALHRLMDLAPQTARRRRADGGEEIVPVASLQAGDLALLRPGDRVPTDGIVMDGESAADESMLTGESIPVEKRAGSLLYGGTTVVNGRLTLKVTATGDGTALAQIIAAVQRAQTSRANIQRLGDRVSSVFVPIVVSVALGAGLWWGFAPESARQIHTSLAPYLWPTHLLQDSPVAVAFIIAAAVLIISCPCAMGLATPAAIMAGANAAARRGILIRDGVALENAGRVTAVVFDKTGTLTVGKPGLEKVWTPEGGSGTAEARLAAGLAQHSTHPVSQAMARMAEPAPGLVAWEEISGAGVQARLSVEAEQLRLGSLRWLMETGVGLDAGQGFIDEWSAQGATLVGLAQGHRLAALFAIRDTVKPGAGEVIRQLRAQGFQVYLVTGDNRATALSIARMVGIDAVAVHAEIRPEQKAGFVKDLQQKGGRVAFVGDGINDAPALRQANLGIAVTRASDIAREAADILLLSSEIEVVPEALGLARATLRTIRQNLFWAFFYNAVGIPLAALGFMSPILCAAAMGASDLVVIGNALRLRHWRLPTRHAPRALPSQVILTGAIQQTQNAHGHRGKVEIQEPSQYRGKQGD